MIHETANIENGAKIAKDVIVGPFCFIGKDVVIEEGCTLESHIIIKGKVHIEKKCRIFSFTSIGQEKSIVSIGSKTYIREFCQIDTQDKESDLKKVTIGSNNFLMAYAQIFSGVSLGDFCILINAVKIYKNVSCSDKVIISGVSIIEEDVKIGTGVMIGGASYVDKDIPMFTLAEGNRVQIKGLNIIGLRRRLKNKKDIEEIKAIFKKLLGSEIKDEKLLKTQKEQYIKELAPFV